MVDITLGTVKATLDLMDCSDNRIASNLDLTLWFYQNGIMRALLEEPDSTRFRISDEDIPVVEEQLIAADLTDKVTIEETFFEVSGLEHNDATESFRYVVDFEHFKITQYAGDIVTLIMNPIDSLYIEEDGRTHEEKKRMLQSQDESEPHLYAGRLQ